MTDRVLDFDEAHVTGPPDDCERDHAVGDARAERRHDRQRESKPRDREKQVGNPHDGGTNEAAPVPGDDSERHAESGADARDDDTDPEGGPGAHDDARQDVGPHLVGPERVGEARRKEALAEVDGPERVLGIGRERRPEDREQQENKHEPEPEHRRKAFGEEVRIRRHCRIALA